MAAQVSLESLLQTFDIDIQLLGKNFNVYNYIHTTINTTKNKVFKTKAQICLIYFYTYIYIYIYVPGGFIITWIMLGLKSICFIVLFHFGVPRPIPSSGSHRNEPDKRILGPKRL